MVLRALERQNPPEGRMPVSARERPARALFAGGDTEGHRGIGCSQRALWGPLRALHAATQHLTGRNRW